MLFGLLIGWHEQNDNNIEIVTWVSLVLANTQILGDCWRPLPQNSCHGEAWHNTKSARQPPLKTLCLQWEASYVPMALIVDITQY